MSFEIHLLPKLLAECPGFGVIFTAHRRWADEGGDTRCAPVSDLGIFQEALFSYINAFVDSTEVQTSKSVQLIMGIWRADHMLPMLKWWRNGRKISHAQVLALIVIISKQQQWRLLFCAFALRNAGGSHVESSHRRFPSGGWRNNKWFVDLHCQCQITLISSINANPILCELFPWSPTWTGGGGGQRTAGCIIWVFG